MLLRPSPRRVPSYRAALHRYGSQSSVVASFDCVNAPERRSRVGIGTGGRRAGPERVPTRGPALGALMRRATSARAAFGDSSRLVNARLIGFRGRENELSRSERLQRRCLGARRGGHSLRYAVLSRLDLRVVDACRRAGAAVAARRSWREAVVDDAAVRSEAAAQLEVSFDARVCGIPPPARKF